MRDKNGDILYMFKVLLLCLVFCLVIFLLCVSFETTSKKAEVEAIVGVDLAGVIIDAGHGGRDGGAGSADGILEKDLNLSVAETLHDIFNVCGINSIMTRLDDSLVCDENDPALKGKYKMTDLNNRLKVSKENPQALFVSIHMNKFSVEKYNGLQVYFSPNNDLSYTLADSIQKKVAEMLQPDNSRQVKRAGSNIFLLDRVTAPAVLIECGFLSNIAETKKLSEQVYRTKLSLIISESIMLNLCDNWNN